MNILPFRGYRYNLDKVGNLDDVISPPYDQFKEGLDDFLYQRHPFNIARLIVNKETPQDSATDNRYTRSRNLLKQWLDEGVFVRDMRPSLYPYFQEYEAPGSGTRIRKGFVALGEVTDYDRKIVLPHERTLSKPKEDRLNLLRATLADTGLVFVLYSDPSGVIEGELDAVTARAADLAADDLQQEKNLLWRVDDNEVIKRVQDAMLDKSVIIADGHHRYEVALAFHRETAPRIAEHRDWQLYGYKLMSFVRLESAGITIFPIHRVLHSLSNFDPLELLQRLDRFFVLQDFCFQPDTKFSVLQEVVGTMKERQNSNGENTLGLYLPALQKFVRLSLREDASALAPWPEDKSPTWRKLDVSVLQVVILDQLLGIRDKQLVEQSNLKYVSQHDDAVRLTDEKSYPCAFLLNPTPIQHVKDVVEAGDILPQKSTHFHPKFMEGLVFAKHR